MGKIEILSLIVVSMAVLSACGTPLNFASLNSNPASSNSNSSSLASPTWTGVIAVSTDPYYAYSDYYGSSLYLDSSQNVFMVGYTSADLVSGSGAGPNPSNDSAFILKYDPSGNKVAAAEFGVTTGQWADATSVAGDSGGNVFMAGITVGNVITGTGGATGTRDYFLAKYDNSLHEIWRKQGGVASYAIQHAMLSQVPNSSIYLTGSTSGNLVSGSGAGTGSFDSFVRKFDESGNIVWTRQYGIASRAINVYASAVDSQDNVYLTGATGANLVSGSGASTGANDAYIMKYDASGTRSTLVQIGVSGKNVMGYAMALDSSSNIYIAGKTSTNLVAGSGSSTGTYDLFISKYDSTGTKLWTNQLGQASKYAELDGMTLDSSGNILVTGQTNGNLVTLSGGSNSGNSDLIVAKYDSAGNQIWLRQHGTSGTPYQGYGIVTDWLGNVYVDGDVGSSQVFLLYFNSAGVMQ